MLLVSTEVKSTLKIIIMQWFKNDKLHLQLNTKQPLTLRKALLLHWITDVPQKKEWHKYSNSNLLMYYHKLSPSKDLFKFKPLSLSMLIKALDM